MKEKNHTKWNSLERKNYLCRFDFWFLIFFFCDGSVNGNWNFNGKESSSRKRAQERGEKVIK